MNYSEPPPAGAMALGAFLGWCIFIAIVLAAIRLLISMGFGVATSAVEHGRRLKTALHPTPEAEVNHLLETAGMKATEQRRVLLPGMTFGKKSVAERMVQTVERDHPEMEPALKATKAGWGVEVNDIDE